MKKIAESIKEVLQAYLDNKIILCDDAELSGIQEMTSFPPVTIEGIRRGLWQIKDRTININGFEVPEPYRGEIKENDIYWFPDLDDNVAEYYIWRDDLSDIKIMENGLLHLTQEAAEIHLKALLSFTKQEIES